MPASPNSPPDWSLDGRVAIDLACVACGYNLRTQAEDGVCPECAASVFDSRPLSAYPARVRKRLFLGGLLLLIAIPMAYFREPALDFLLADTVSVFNSASQWPLNEPVVVHSIWWDLVPIGSIALIGGLILLGVVWITDRRAKACRVACVAGVALRLLALLANHGWIGHVWTVYFVLDLVATTAGLVAVLLLLGHVRRRLLRMASRGGSRLALCGRPLATLFLLVGALVFGSATFGMLRAIQMKPPPYKWAMEYGESEYLIIDGSTNTRTTTAPTALLERMNEYTDHQERIRRNRSWDWFGIHNKIAKPMNSAVRIWSALAYAWLAATVWMLFRLTDRRRSERVA